MRFREFHPNIKIRMIVSFFTELVGIMIIPLMPIYFAESLGPALTGVLLAVNVLAGLLSGFFGGFYADRVGRKKLMVIAEIGFLAAYAVSALCNSPWFHSEWMTYAMMLAISVCWGLFGPSSDAMILDVSKPEERKYIYTFQYWIHNLSVAVGGMIGVLLFKDYLFELLIALTFAGLVSMLTTVFFIKETHFVSPATKTASGSSGGAGGSVLDILHNYGSVLKDKLFLIFVMSSLMTVFVEFNMSNYVSVRLAAEMPLENLFHWRDWRLDLNGLGMIGFMRTENTILIVLGAAFAAKWFSRYAEKYVLFFGYAVNVAGYSVIGYSNQAYLLIAAMLMATLGEMMYVPIKQSYLGSIPPKDARSSYMAVHSLVNRGATLLAGLFVTLGGFLPSWAMASIIFLTGVAGMYLLYGIMPGLEARKKTAE